MIDTLLLIQWHIFKGTHTQTHNQRIKFGLIYFVFAILLLQADVTYSEAPGGAFGGGNGGTGGRGGNGGGFGGNGGRGGAQASYGAPGKQDVGGF